MIEFRIYLRGGGVIGPYAIENKVLDALQDEWLAWFEDHADGTDGVYAPNAIHPFTASDLVDQTTYNVEVILGEIVAIITTEHTS